MLNKKISLQLSLILLMIIGLTLTACQKDPITDPPIDAIENETTQNDNNTQGEDNDAQLKSLADCEELLAELLGTYTEDELAELGIDPETFCDEIEWDDDEEWDDIDWEMECDSIVAMYAAELEAFGFDPETFCEDIFDGVLVVEIDLEDVTAENCDSLVAMYADELEALGIDPETFCDEWNGEWDDDNDWDEWGDWDDIDWTADCDSLVAIYADQLEEWGIDPETLCGEWGDGNDDNDWDDWGDIDWTTDCDSLVAMYADQLEEWGLDPDTFCDEWGGDWNDDWDDWGEWDDIDWSMDCDSLVATYGEQLEDWGFDLGTFCDEWNGDWDYGNAVCCIVSTECGVLAYSEPVEVVAENGQITVFNEEGDVLDSIECEGESVEVECHGG